MSRIVMVTGAAGFVGSHLIEALLADGCVVHAHDRVPLDLARNLEDVVGHERLHYTCGDLRDAAGVDEWFRPDAEVIYHLASIVGVRYYMEDPLGLIDVVVGGTRTLLELAARHNVRFLFTSTSEIFGKNPAIPWPEDADRVLGPTSVDRWSYSSAKAVCEHMIYGMHRARGLRFSIVRFFNAYGPRQNPIYVVSQSVHRALRGENPDVYDGGGQTRCFTYVGDVVQGVVAASREDAALGEVFNLGSSVETTMSEVVDVVCDVAGTGVRPQPLRTEMHYGPVYEDISRRVPAVDKARAVLGWQATTTLREGVQTTVDWSRQHPWYLADIPASDVSAGVRQSSAPAS